jgi:glycerophosphoryl diester phosphodiesterase
MQVSQSLYQEMKAYSELRKKYNAILDKFNDIEEKIFNNRYFLREITPAEIKNKAKKYPTYKEFQSEYQSLCKEIKNALRKYKFNITPELKRLEFENEVVDQAQAMLNRWGKTISNKIFAELGIS